MRLEIHAYKAVVGYCLFEWKLFLLVKNDRGITRHRLLWAQVPGRNEAADLYRQLRALCIVANDGQDYGMPTELPPV